MIQNYFRCVNIASHVQVYSFSVMYADRRRIIWHSRNKSVILLFIYSQTLLFFYFQMLLSLLSLYRILIPFSRTYVKMILVLSDRT